MEYAVLEVMSLRFEEILVMPKQAVTRMLHCSACLVQVLVHPHVLGRTTQPMQQQQCHPCRRVHLAVDVAQPQARFGAEEEEKFVWMDALMKVQRWIAVATKSSVAVLSHQTVAVRDLKVT